MLASTPVATIAATLQANGLNVPIATIHGGRGGTSISERVPATANFIAETDGITHAGGDFAVAYNGAGQFDVNPTERATYVANFNAIFSAHQTSIGRTLKVVEMPVGAIWGFSDADMEALRRLQARQPITNATIACFLGPYMMDQAHSDLYHLNATSNSNEQARRLAFSHLKALGLVTYDRTGPIMDVATAPVYNAGAQTVAVTFDLNGAGGMSMLNPGGGALTSGAGALGGDYRGGMRFWVSTVGGTEKFPNAVNIGAPSGGKVVVTWTFPAASFSAAPFVGGPYGSNPFNSFNNTTLNAAAQWNNAGAGANILQGTYAGEPNVPVQPVYVGASGPDGVQAA